MNRTRILLYGCHWIEVPMPLSTVNIVLQRAYEQKKNVEFDNVVYHLSPTKVLPSTQAIVSPEKIQGLIAIP